MYFLRIDSNGKTLLHVPTNRQNRITRSHAKALLQVLTELDGLPKANGVTLVLSNLARIHPDSSCGVDSWQGISNIKEQINKMTTRRGPDLQPRRINPRSLCNLRAFTKETAPRLKVSAPWEKRKEVETYLAQGLSLAVAADKAGISAGQAKYIITGMSEQLQASARQNDVSTSAGGN